MGSNAERAGDSVVLLVAERAGESMLLRLLPIMVYRGRGWRKASLNVLMSVIQPNERMMSKIQEAGGTMVEGESVTTMSDGERRLRGDDLGA